VLFLAAAKARKRGGYLRQSRQKRGLDMMNTDKKSGKGFWQKLNDAVTEVGIEHANDDFDWDQRVKLPEWQLVRLKERYVKREQLKKQK
jgi:hypothetical protein